MKYAQKNGLKISIYGDKKIAFSLEKQKMKLICS